ncbi:MAG: hypothetical protein ACE5H8_11335 [Alphaproteobacteria bacterium]
MINDEEACEAGPGHVISPTPTVPDASFMDLRDTAIARLVAYGADNEPAVKSDCPTRAVRFLNQPAFVKLLKFLGGARGLEPRTR